MYRCGRVGQTNGITYKANGLPNAIAKIPCRTMSHIAYIVQVRKRWTGRKNRPIKRPTNPQSRCSDLFRSYIGFSAPYESVKANTTKGHFPHLCSLTSMVFKFRIVEQSSELTASSCRHVLAVGK